MVINKNILSFIFLFHFTCFGTMVTYDLGGGRFGDQLLGYLHAKWISFKYQIPLVYKPFCFSDQLALHYLERHINHANLKEKVFTSEKELQEKLNHPMLYTISYFSEDITELRTNNHWTFFNVDWNHPEFKKKLKYFVNPINIKTAIISAPKNSISVALHIRVGAGFDYPLDATNLFVNGNNIAQAGSPTKFPPLTFYIEQLKNLSLLLGNPNLYVFVFTDVSDTALIVDKIMSELKEFDNIMFDYRKKDNYHDKNVLEDFFALTKFDCLIRPQSNFSLVAAKLADYLIEIYPVDFKYQNGIPIIHKKNIKTQYHNFCEQLRALVNLNQTPITKKGDSDDRKNAYPFISGDSFRAISDHLFDETNKSLDPKHVKAADIIFLKTDYMEEFFTSIHPKIKNKYILITHNSDLSAPGKFKKFLDDEKIIKWFGMNPDAVDHNKFIPIPIGIANRYCGHGQPTTFINVLSNSSSERDILLGMNFEFTTKKRVPIYELFSRTTFCKNISAKAHSLYLLNMEKTKFVLSPPGNGLDCHRTWEALLMGAFPIVETSNLDSLFEKLPVVIIKNWKDITEEFLEKTYKQYMRTKFNYEKLIFDYWSNLILSYKKGSL